MESTVLGRLPQLRDDVKVNPYAEKSGAVPRFLVQAGSACFVVNSEVRDLIEALRTRPDTLAQLADEFRSRSGKSTSIETLKTVIETRLSPALFENQPTPKLATPFVINFRVLSARIAQAITKRLTWTFSWPVAVIAVLAFSVMEYRIFTMSFSMVAADSTWYRFLLLYAGVALGGLIHEMGHLTACARYGSRHGGVGVGLYLVFPAFYADVTDAWRLPRRSRVAVDLGGLYFQAIFLVFVGFLALYTKSMAFYQLNFFTLILMLFTLNPALRFDGYWLLVDLSGIHNLASRRSAMIKSIFGHTKRVPGTPALDGETKPLVAVYAGMVFLFSSLLLALGIAATYRIAQQYPAKVASAMHAFSQAIATGRIKDAVTTVGTLGTDSFWLLLVAMYVFDVARKVLDYDWHRRH